MICFYWYWCILFFKILIMCYYFLIFILQYGYNNSFHKGTIFGVHCTYY